MEYLLFIDPDIIHELWYSSFYMRTEIIRVELTPEEFAKGISGKKSPDGELYQVMISFEGNEEVVSVRDIGEIKPGQEFTLEVKIVEEMKK